VDQEEDQEEEFPQGHQEVEEGWKPKIGEHWLRQGCFQWPGCWLCPWFRAWLQGWMGSAEEEAVQQALVQQALVQQALVQQALVLVRQEIVRQAFVIPRSQA